jgi:phosphatidylglycerophosphate synthase
MKKDFSYEKTLKTDPENDFFNIQSYFLITSKQIIKLLYNTSITPHQVILVSLLIGIFSSLLIIQENKIIVIIGALLLFYKNVLDKVDGSLARAKEMATRRGRFYDSISDFIVSFFLFTTMSYKLYIEYNSYLAFLVGFTALIMSMLQCSYFIYYQVSFIKFTGTNTINRLVEKVTEEDLLTEDKFTLLLQKIFIVIYGWQDILFDKLNNNLLNRLKRRFNSYNQELINSLWYSNRTFLTLASFLGIGTHMVLIALFAVLDKFEIYFFLNLIIWNLLLIFTVIYHYNSFKIRTK